MSTEPTPSLAQSTQTSSTHSADLQKEVADVITEINTLTHETQELYRRATIEVDASSAAELRNKLQTIKS